jgi:hypothetical protein
MTDLTKHRDTLGKMSAEELRDCLFKIMRLCDSWDLAQQFGFEKDVYKSILEHLRDCELLPKS